MAPALPRFAQPEPVGGRVFEAGSFLHELKRALFLARSANLYRLPDPPNGRSDFECVACVRG